MTQEAASKDEIKRRAIIIGTNYEGCKGGIPKLEGAQHDAEEIYERLHDSEFGGFDVPDNHRLIGADATSENIRKAISEVFYDTEVSCDLALFYFSGHGFNDKWYSDLYLAPYDMDKKQPFVKGIKKSELNQVIAKAVPNQVKCALVILDCCYSGLDTNSNEREIGPEKTFDEHIRDFSSEAEGLIVIGSSGGEETAKEIDLLHQDGTKHKHGAFSSWLIDGLDNLTGSEGTESEGKILFRDLWEHIEKRSNEAKQKGITQKPIMNPASIKGFGSIEIAISRANWNSKLQPKLEKAAKCEGCSDPYRYIGAVALVQDILALNPKHARALEIKGIINTGLEGCKKAVQYWVMNNKFKIKTWILDQEIPDVASELDRLALKFPDFDAVAKYSIKEKEMLASTCQVAMKIDEESEEVFKLFLRQQAANLPSTAKEAVEKPVEVKKIPSKVDGFA